MMPERFNDRADAGRQLAARLAAYANRDDVVVLGLPRGGVPVAFEVAKSLAAPLDVFVVRKLGVPGREEYAMGAIASGGVRVVNEDAVQWLGISPATLDAVAAREQAELERREREYRDHRPVPELSQRIVIVVDDGLATGASMQAAVRALRTRNPARIVVAIPTGSPQACEMLRQEADEVVAVMEPENFQSVGGWYRDFSQTTDAEVRELLARR